MVNLIPLQDGRVLGLQPSEGLLPVADFSVHPLHLVVVNSSAQGDFPNVGRVGKVEVGGHEIGRERVGDYGLKRHKVAMTEEMEKRLEMERKKRALDSIPGTIRYMLSEYLVRS